MVVLRFFARPAVPAAKHAEIEDNLRSVSGGKVIELEQTESCYYVNVNGVLNAEQTERLEWLLSPTHREPLKASDSSELIVEVGPRLNFETPSSTQAVGICQTIGLDHVTRIEKCVRYLIRCSSKDAALTAKLYEALHDKMTEQIYEKTLSSFELDAKPDSWSEVDILGQGRAALEKCSKELGLAFDDWDLDYYTNLFKSKLKRNPSTVECFDLAQSNSEHSRHWFFKGDLIVDGKPEKQNLFQIIQDTQNKSNDNNVIKFSDNSSAIKGFKTQIWIPEDPCGPSRLKVEQKTRHLLFTAETHNFPTGVAPFSGATTGTGGRIRDTHATGRGSHEIAGTAGYSFGNLHVPGYDLPWEESWEYPPNFAPPLQVAVEASNGASDYGNKFGEPVLAGFSRSFGMRLANGERKEYVKPIMFSAGFGCIDEDTCIKVAPEKGMLVVKLGGPVYRIGVGGGAASSVVVQGDQSAKLDFDAVQRGDAEMEQKLHRLVRACVERGIDANPIQSIHDQGAGGNGNVLKEICEPAGAIIRTKEFQLGDPTINTMELWGAEYQENDAILCKAEDREVLQQISKRERCPVNFVGEVTGTGRIVLEEHDGQKRPPVDLDLESVLGHMPSKTFRLDSYKRPLKALKLPDGLQMTDALHRVLRLPSVASKRFLTSKVDRCVTGLVAQQQCVGPLHTPLADVAVVALSYFDKVGGATSIGEQPVKGILSPSAGARMSVAEAVTNLMFARISCLRDVKCSGNWMWPAKLPGEGGALVEACKAMCDTMAALGIAVDGGKDSLSMAARVGSETVKSPGTIVVSCYAPSPDITLTVTPDIKGPSSGMSTCLIHVSCSPGKARLGGTALAQVYKQLGDTVCDLEKPEILKNAFEVTQSLLDRRIILSGHDVSDGGVITCVLEMLFAGNCGATLNILSNGDEVSALFNEEVGFILEIKNADCEAVMKSYNDVGTKCVMIGETTTSGPRAKISITCGASKIESTVAELRDIWEATSFELENYQTNRDCAAQERRSLRTRTTPLYNLTDAITLQIPKTIANRNIKVAVVREEGVNSDREMQAALYLAGFESWDVTMTDLLDGRITLSEFRGLVFPGGFSYADVLGSARGWAAGFKYHNGLRSQLETFKRRRDTFSLGVCNGCQLMALLGWICPGKRDQPGVSLLQNVSGRFECRYSNVRIEESNNIWLKGMEGAIMGVWTAHGEGRFDFQNAELMAACENKNLVTVRYVDDKGAPTQVYPLNPNGSPNAIAGLSSECGRHLALMPHPERCFLPWQCAHWPTNDARYKNATASPWLQIFVNAHKWATSNTK
ncbi:phosphoribosylformylglycinamidine synthase [Galendromus occidentalis]|uniref:Phosphoribosylformylglycinamidine synthase n=1 Tax=Galendromus occidentalis TaxID=34638 RepID=A0AAJ6QXZ3_9ACAR|nr:phosphoribosylformylglycinamidine synthase [Galendromus occidentalis]